MQDGRRPHTHSPSLASRFMTLIWQIPVQAANSIRPLYPHIVPLVTCLAVIPFLVFFSFVAGWLVWASVPRGWSVPIYLQYGDGRPPYAEFTLPKLVPGQRYEVALHISAPSIPSNYELGNFMTSLTIATSDNFTIATARIPSVLLPPSSSLPLPFLKPRTIRHTVPLINAFTPPSSRTYGRIQIGRDDSWRALGHGGGRELTVISTELRGGVRPKGFQTIMFRFPLTLSFISAVSFFLIAGGVVMACLLQSGPVVDDESKEEESDKEDIPLVPVTDAPAIVDDDADGFEDHAVLSVISSVPTTPPEMDETPLTQVRRRLQRALEAQ